MGEGRGGLFRRLSMLLWGAGLAVGIGGVWLGWGAPAFRPPAPNPSIGWDVPPAPGPSPTFIESEPPFTPSPQPAPGRPPQPAASPERDPPLRLRIPSLQLDAPVVPARLTTVREGGQEFITWEPPNRFAAGWLTTSADPGQPGNVVLIGHHNIYGKVFADLHRLRPGQRIWIETRRGVYVYAVEAVHILPEKGQPLEVRRRNLQWVLPTLDERLTLVTCWPPNNNTHRLVVVARPAEGP